MEASQIQLIVKEYILKEVLPGEDPAELQSDTELVSTGILDSLATLSLVTFLEEEFDVQIEAHEADEEHLNTLRAIAHLVASKF